MWNLDIWMHLRTGQLILEQGGVPQSDWYSFTDPDQRWISIHWLFQIVVAKLYSWGGVESAASGQGCGTDGDRSRLLARGRQKCADMVQGELHAVVGSLPLRTIGRQTRHGYQCAAGSLAVHSSSFPDASKAYLAVARRPGDLD